MRSLRKVGCARGSSSLARTAKGADQVSWERLKIRTILRKGPDGIEESAVEATEVEAT
jgi:hypothetical protein